MADDTPQEPQEEPKRHLFQFRKKDARCGHRDPYYTPERDIAHIGPDIARAAMAAMEEEWWEPWFKQYMQDQGLTYDTLLETKAPLLFAQAMNAIIRTKDPVVALKESGFADLPAPLQMIFYARLGQCCLAMIWTGVKDVSAPESDPPATIGELLADVEAMFTKMMEANAPNSDQT
jgi:hypothetical protein